MEAQTNGIVPSTATSDRAQPRAVYQTPSLRVLGTLADLTATGSKKGKETGGNRAGGQNFP